MLARVSRQKVSENLAKWRSTYSRRRKYHHVINLQLDADLLADFVVVMRGDEREHFAAGGKLERVKNIGTAKRLVQYLGLTSAVVVVQDVIGTQQDFDGFTRL